MNQRALVQDISVCITHTAIYTPVGWWWAAVVPPKRIRGWKLHTDFRTEIKRDPVNTILEREAPIHNHVHFLKTDHAWHKCQDKTT